MLLFIFGAAYFFQEKLSIGDFIALSSYYSLGINALSYFLGIGNQYISAKVSFKRINELKEQYSHNTPKKLLKIYQQNNVNSIEIKNLIFNYFNKKIFDHLNLSFKKNHIYGILGTNGIGKSTLIYLMLGIYENYRGNIYVDGLDIKELDMVQFRKEKVSVMEQEPFLISSTIKDNIYLFKDNCSFSEANIKKWENDFCCNTRLYEEIQMNNKLSGGEKQQITFLRTISKNASIMIFDEPTASLDKSAIISVSNAIKDLSNNKIIILISHDVSLCNKTCTDIVNLGIS